MAGPNLYDLGTMKESSPGGLTRQEVLVTGRYEGDFKRQSKRRRQLKLNQVLYSCPSKGLLLILRGKSNEITCSNLKIKFADFLLTLHRVAEIH